MNDSVETYKTKILDINQKLRDDISAGLMLTLIANDYQLNYMQILLDASQENNWPEIAENIAFYLYAGTVTDELFQRQVGLHNVTINLVNMAASKNVESQTEIDQLNEIAAQKAEREKKGAVAKLANDNQHQNMLKVEKEYMAKYEDGITFKFGRLTEFYRNMASKYGLDQTSVKNRIERFRREHNHTKP